MQEFNIKQLEQLTGIKAHTLRIWEKRYNLITPDRTGGKHRSYSNEDLQHILRVVYLYNKGIKISKIAGLKEKDILQKMDDDLEHDLRADELLPRLLEACIDLNEKKIKQILTRVESQLGLEQMVFKLLYPFLEKLGSAWVIGKVLPNNEHFISHIISSTIILATSRLNIPKAPAGDQAILLFQPAGEWHEIPLLFIRYQLCKLGCKTIYFGSNVGVSALEDYLSVKKVSHLYYHVITNLGEADPQEFIDKMADTFPAIIIVASGPSINKLTANYPNQLLLKSQAEMTEFIQQAANSMHK
jgi:MerR family transcriptional regulator, light-induced transcriptional regulator